MIRRTLLMMTAAVLLASRVASAAPTIAEKCEIKKDKAAGKKAACLTAQHAKEIAGGTPNIARCETAFTNAFARAETAATNAGWSCPVPNDAVAIEQRVETATNAIDAAISGVHFVDNGDGTVTDNRTGLQWEQKTGTVGSPKVCQSACPAGDMFSGLYSFGIGRGSVYRGHLYDQCRPERYELDWDLHGFQSRLQ